MSHKDKMTILTGLATVFIITTFNSVLSLNVKLYNITNILLFLIIMTIIAATYFRTIEYTVEIPYDYANLILLVFAGSGIQHKDKYFLFLSLLFILQFLALQFWTRAKSNLQLFCILTVAASAVLSVTIFVLIMLKFFTVTTFFGVAAMLLVLQGLMLFLFLKSKFPEEAKDENGA